MSRLECSIWDPEVLERMGCFYFTVGLHASVPSIGHAAASCAAAFGGPAARVRE